jgi:2-desacetyl-2-hydroxyethyl bacteriochlorophyllide A dehydrogenase
VNAAILRGPRDLRLESTPEPCPGAGDALVRVSIAGLCGTDYRIWTGERAVAYPRILGHEFAGVVQGLGRDVERLRVGDRVVVEPNYSCGRCVLCREGNRNLCPSRVAVGIDVDGSFAELTRVPARCCWPVPAGLPDEAVVVTEPLAVVVRAVNRAAPKPGETAAVVGAGSLGLLAVQVLRARGLRVMVVSRTTRRFGLARELGAERTDLVADGPLESAVREFSGRAGVDLVIETAGTAEAVAPAIALVRPGGRVVLTGLPHAPSSVSFFPVVRREVSIVGSMIYQDEFGDAVRLLESGAVKTDRLVTRRFPLVAIAEAFVAHREAAAVKVAIVP